LSETYRNTILCGDALEQLKRVPDKHVQMCVTSPPYFGLRDYLTASWEGGDDSCNHYRDSKQSASCNTGQKNVVGSIGDGIYKDVCRKCGAVRIDKQIGLEESPEKYIDNLVNVFREVKRVLKDDGTLWLNIGDSYYNYRLGKGQGLSTAQAITNGKRNLPEEICPRRGNKFSNIKEKDLIGIPWMLAFALRADGWYLRCDIIWSKLNGIPESVKDRPTRSHEYIFLLSKNKNYYYDNEAIKEPCAESTIPRLFRAIKNSKYCKVAYGQTIQGINKPREKVVALFPDGKIDKKYEMRNKRSVWSVSIKPFKDAHFATYPPDLIIPPILAGSKKGDIVLDPFGGAGTTGIIAKRYEREYLLIELNPEYIKMAQKRIDKVTVQGDMFDE